MRLATLVADQHELALISFQNCYEYSNGNNLASLVNVWVAKRTLSDWNFDESIINTKIDGEVKERWHLINGGEKLSRRSSPR